MCITGIVTFEITRRNRCSTGNVTLDYLNDANWLARKLALNNKQIEEITKLQTEYRNKLETIGNAHCTACCKLRTVLFENDDKQSIDLVEEMSRTQKESELITVKHIRQVHELLNPDQRKQFEKMVKTCIGACSPNGKCAKSCEGG